MKVEIKDLGIKLEVKSRGVSFGVSNTKGKHVGNLYVTSTKLVWCPGKTDIKNGVSITWPEFVAKADAGELF